MRSAVASRPRVSISVTSAPNERYSDANSRPTAPAPITAADAGRRSSVSAWSLVMIRLLISIPGSSFGYEPVAMTTAGASSRRPSTSTAFRATSFPVPRTTSIFLQEQYLERARRFADHRGLDGAASRILEEWEGALTALRRGDHDRLRTKIDWVAKHQLIRAFREKHGYSLSHPKVALMDLAYHDVNRERGLYYLLERRGRTELCKDPFRSRDDRVEQLIAHM